LPADQGSTYSNSEKSPPLLGLVVCGSGGRPHSWIENEVLRRLDYFSGGERRKRVRERQKRERSERKRERRGDARREEGHVLRCSRLNGFSNAAETSLEHG
jgi:hypothetical protein